MKRLHFTIITITLLLSQWGVIEHAFHEHVAGEVCEYCLTAKSFDDIVLSSDQAVVPAIQSQISEVLFQAAKSETFSHYYSIRAPPQFI